MTFNRESIDWLRRLSDREVIATRWLFEAEAVKLETQADHARRSARLFEQEARRRAEVLAALEAEFHDAT